MNMKRYFKDARSDLLTYAGVIIALLVISTQLSNSVVFAVLIIILLVRPAGLLGKHTQEKV